MAIRTIFTMVEDCAQGRRQGWQEFVRDYGFVGRRLLELYFPALAADLGAHLTGVFRHARRDNNAWFGSFQFANEREFLMEFRELFFAYGDEVSPPPQAGLSLDQMRQVMAGLPVTEREILWLLVKGYTPAQIAPMMMNMAATAEAVETRSGEALAGILPGSSGRTFTDSARVLTQAARKTRTPDCLPYKTFNNFVNGQLSWRERTLAEEHIQECFYCIDRFTSFQEMVRFRKDSQPLPEAEVEAILQRLELPAARPKGMLARLFSRA
jgi:hypothetical protein